MNNTLMLVIISSGILGLIGIIFSIIGIVILKNKKKKEINCTSKVYGKVKDIVRCKSYDAGGGYSYNWYPVFEYNIGELKFIKESSYGTSQSKYAIGQNVEIFYNPEDYNEYYVAGDTLPKTLGTTFTAVGIIVIIISIFSAILLI